jgi:hypothetical protein
MATKTNPYKSVSLHIISERVKLELGKIGELGQCKL